MLSGQQSGVAYEHASGESVALRHEVGYLLCAGSPRHDDIFDSALRRPGESVIAIPADAAWRDTMERKLGRKAGCVDRRWMKWSGVVSVTRPRRGSIRRLDRALLRSVGAVLGRNLWEAWPDEQTFLQHGFGYVAQVGGCPVSACVSYSIGRGYAEAAVFTRPEFRRLGYGFDVSQAFVHACLKRGYVPSWSHNATNVASRRLAASIGFLRGHSYVWLVVRDGERIAKRR